MDQDSADALVRQTAAKIAELLQDLERKTGRPVEQISIARMEVTQLGDRVRVYRKHVVIELQDLAGEGWPPTL